MDEQTTPKKTRRVGTLAFALVLILAGVLLMLYQLVPGFDLLWILRFSPAILIVLGIELLFYSSKPDAKVRFDWFGICGAPSGSMRPAASSPKRSPASITP